MHTAQTPYFEESKLFINEGPEDLPKVRAFGNLFKDNVLVSDEQELKDSAIRKGEQRVTFEESHT